MLWVLLALLTALSESLKDLFSKRGVAHADPLVVAWALRFFALLVIVPLAVWQGMPTLGGSFWWALVVDALLNVVATILYTRALGMSDLSVSVPLVSFTPLFMLATSPLIVGEMPDAIGVAGIVLIVVGSWLLNVRERTNGLLAPMRALLREPGARLMLLVAAIYSITSNVDKIGVESSSPIFWSFAVSALMALVLSPLAWLRSRHRPMAPSFDDLRERKRRRALLLILAGVFSGLVVIFQMSAIELTLVAYVVSIKRTSTILSVVWGHILLGEKGFRERLLGTIVMVAGVLLITLG